MLNAIADYPESYKITCADSWKENWSWNLYQGHQDIAYIVLLQQVSYK